MSLFLKNDPQPSANFASGAIYNLYNLDKNTINIENIIYDTSNKTVKKYEAIGIKYKDKGWIIHVTGPNTETNYEDNMLKTYTSIFNIFLKILKKDNKKYNLRLSLVGLGSFLPTKYKRINKEKLLNSILSKILTKENEERFIALNENKISIALGESFKN